MPTVYIGKSQEDYSSGSSSINAPGVMPRRLYMLTQRQELRPRIAGTLNSMENAIDGTLILPVID